MRSELREIQKRTGVTFIYITHDQGEALTMSDRIGVMSRGVLAAGGRRPDHLRRPGQRLRRLLRRRDQPLHRPRHRGGRRQGRHRDAVRQDDRPQPARHARGRRGDPVRPAGADAPRRWDRRPQHHRKPGQPSGIRRRLRQCLPGTGAGPDDRGPDRQCRPWQRQWLAAGYGGAGQLPPRRRRRPSHSPKTCHERGAAPLRPGTDHGDRGAVRLLARRADRAAPVADGRFLAPAQPAAGKAGRAGRRLHRSRTTSPCGTTRSTGASSSRPSGPARWSRRSPSPSAIPWPISWPRWRGPSRCRC